MLARFILLAFNTSLGSAERLQQRERGRCKAKHTTLLLLGLRPVGLGTFEEERAMHETGLIVVRYYIGHFYSHEYMHKHHFTRMSTILHAHVVFLHSIHMHLVWLYIHIFNHHCTYVRDTALSRRTSDTLYRT